MSYSRWGGIGSGRWYTYWCAQNEETRDNALFDVCLVYMFKAKKIRDDIDGCIQMVADMEPGATSDELEELRGYMKEFLEDVDKEYAKEEKDADNSLGDNTSTIIPKGV